jgi:hypothetical protein
MNFVIKKNVIFWDVYHVALVRIDILKDCITSIIRVRIISEGAASVASYC